MKKAITKKIALVLVLVMIMALSACGAPANPQPDGGDKAPAQTQYLTFAAPPSTSALYTYFVAIAKAISETYPEYNITVSESQGIADIINKISAGNAIVGNSTTAADYQYYHGTDTYEGKANENARVLWYYDITQIQFAVGADTEINAASDLEGAKFNPGATGGATATCVMNALKALKITPDYYEATQGDALDAYSDRIIQGTTKQGSAPDSFVLQLQAARDTKILSFTADELEAIQNDYPYLTPCNIPAGTYDFVDYDIDTFQVVGSVQTTSDLSQEDGYKFIKAVFEGDGYNTVISSYPATAKYDLIDLTLSSACSKLHSGTVQYFVEQGVEVPAELIPDEYVPV